MIAWFHPQPGPAHERLAALLSHAWGVPVAFGPESATHEWADSGWLNAPSTHEPPQDDVAAWIYWRTWSWEQRLTKDAHQRPVGAGADRDLRVPEAELRARQWAQALGIPLPKLERPNPVLVVDIDHLFAYRGRGAAAYLGGLLRDALTAKLTAVRRRIWGPDPFDSLTYWTQLGQDVPQLDVQFFALLAARKGPYDRGVRAESAAVQQRLQQLQLRFDVATHLSYGSHDAPEGYREELRALEDILGRPVVRQRSHFLRAARSEELLHRLRDLGVAEDWSLEFADAPGFRAGWASSVLTSGVVEVPVAAMDQNFLGLSPREIADELHRLQAAAWSVGAPLRVGTHWRLFGPQPEVERSPKDFRAWRQGMELWLHEACSPKA